MTPAFQISFPFLYSLKKMFSPGIKNFAPFFSLLFFLSFFDNSLSNTDLIFLANINSVGDNPELVLGFGVRRYTLKNCKVLSMDLFLPKFF